MLASIISAYSFEAKKKKEINTLKMIINFSNYVKNQIDLFSLPLNQIYTKQNFNNETIRELISNHTVNLNDKSISDELYECYSTLGNGYKGEQLKNLDKLTNFLEKKTKHLEINYPQSIKVYRAISLFVGSCAIILLV